MGQKELLREKIEEERQKLNALLATDGKVEDAYQQSLVMDELIEQYADEGAI